MKCWCEKCKTKTLCKGCESFKNKKDRLQKLEFNIDNICFNIECSNVYMPGVGCTYDHNCSCQLCSKLKEDIKEYWSSEETKKLWINDSNNDERE